MTRSGLITGTSDRPFNSILAELGYKKINNGLWENQTHRIQVYSYGVRPQTEWKVLRDQKPVQTGQGPDDLKKLLTDLANQ